MKYAIHNTNKNKTTQGYIIIFAVIIILYLIAGLYIKLTGCYKIPTLPVSAQQGIAEKIIRFHVIAHSDDTQDQEVKLLIKEKIIDYLNPLLAAVSSKSEAEAVILANISQIIKTAEAKLLDEGFNYPVSASLSQEYFPIKVYGDISLPAGTYDALVINIGEAKGKNWWCIMFPRLCFIEGSYSIVPDSSKAELRYLLTDDEYEAVLNSPIEVTYKLKIVEWLKKIF